MKRVSTVGSMGVLAMCLNCTLADEIVDFGTELEVDNSLAWAAEVPPPPISGGTLAVLVDGNAVAADPDRDQLLVVDLQLNEVLHTVRFEVGDEPGRVVEGADGLVYVVLRGAGAVATVDTAQGLVRFRQSVCTDPRGVAHDADRHRVLVACADGTLVSLSDGPDGEVLERRFVASDLRDVVMLGDNPVVSRFRSAQLLKLSSDTLEVVRAYEPLEQPGASASVAWRLVAVGDSELVALHQYSSTRSLPTDPPETPDDVVSAPYGGGAIPPGGNCAVGIVNPALSFVDPYRVRSIAFPGAAPAVDVAARPGMARVAVAVAGAPAGKPNVVIIRSDEHDNCRTIPLTVPGQITAVALTADGRVVAQSRQPAVLNVLDADLGVRATIELDRSIRLDTGHELFHRATPAGISCAACHPEGGDDGHVWAFAHLGPRRTQPLDVGLEDSAPFHWDGDMRSFRELADEVLGRRMGGMAQSDGRLAIFERWLFSLRRPAAASDVDPVLAAQGEAVFTALGCASCHSGSGLTSLQASPIWGVELQVPSLRRVALRPPYMHDGRSETLREAIIDMIQATASAHPVAEVEVDALEAFLRTR